MRDLRRYILNAPGDFYVVDGACITCMAPHHVAPSLMGFNTDPKAPHCYFSSQPATPQELDAAIAAVSVSCCAALRYGGADPDILSRLKALGSAGACDAVIGSHHMEGAVIVAVVKGWSVMVGGEPHSGWLPPGAATPPPTPVRELVLDLSITVTAGGYNLEWVVRHSSEFNDSWHATEQEAKVYALERFGVPLERWGAAA